MVLAIVVSHSLNTIAVLLAIDGTLYLDYAKNLYVLLVLQLMAIRQILVVQLSSWKPV